MCKVLLWMYYNCIICTLWIRAERLSDVNKIMWSVSGLTGIQTWIPLTPESPCLPSSFFLLFLFNFLFKVIHINSKKKKTTNSVKSVQWKVCLPFTSDSGLPFPSSKKNVATSFPCIVLNISSAYTNICIFFYTNGSILNATLKCILNIIQLFFI